MPKYYISKGNILTPTCLIKLLEKTDKDPKAFKNSKLVKYEKVQITVSERSKFSISVDTCYTDPKTMEVKLKFMDECPEEKYNAIISMFSNEIPQVFEKLNSILQNNK